MDLKSMPGVQEYLAKMLDKLENDQKEIQEKYTSDDGNLTREKQLGIVKDFALTVFKKADETYRSGKATKGTAKGFYAAAAYLEVADAEDEQLSSIRKASKFKVS